MSNHLCSLKLTKKERELFTDVFKGAVKIQEIIEDFNTTPKTHNKPITIKRITNVGKNK